MNELSQGQIYYLNKQRRRRKIVRFSRAAILLGFLFLWELPMGMLYSRRMIRIRRRCVSVQIRICTGIRRR